MHRPMARSPLPSPRSSISRPRTTTPALCGGRRAGAILFARRVQKPLFLEGEAGVGKTEAARALAAGLGARLIRLQCYEGIDLAHAAYEWNYARQLLHIRLVGEREDRVRTEQDVFGPEFLLRRPLLDAIDNHDPVAPVLLIDEIDRSDEEFEAFLLEILRSEERRVGKEC